MDYLEIAKKVLDKGLGQVLLVKVFDVVRIYIIKGRFSTKTMNNPYCELIDGIDLTEFIPTMNEFTLINLESLTENRERVNFKFGTEEYFWFIS